MMTDAEYKERSAYIKAEMQPLRDEVKQIRKEEKSEIIYQLRALNAGMASVHLKVIGQAKDIGFLKGVAEDEKVCMQKLEKRVRSNEKYIAYALAGVCLIGFAIANFARLL